MKRVIGIDPGLIHTGWGIVDIIGSERRYVASGVIKGKGSTDELAMRLAFIFNELGKVIDEFKPTRAAIEITFANKNPKTTLLLGHARATAMLCVSIRNIPLSEFEPNKIKKSISAAGHADKEQVMRMVCMFLPNVRPKTHDESDALAIALCGC